MVRATRVSKKAMPEGAPRERILDAARKLFDSRGFHATTTAELASCAAVSMGQIYRHFESKNDIILTIVEEDARTRIEAMHTIFDAVESGQQTLLEAIEAIARNSLMMPNAGLMFEILAEACRNPSVASRLEEFTAAYRDGVRRLASLARPDLPANELDAYAGIMTASFIGLGHRPALAPSIDIAETSKNTARLMVQALIPSGPV